MPENRDSILSLIDIANTLPDVCSSPCIVELQSLIKQGSGGVTFSATSSVTSEVLVGNKVTYNRLTATSSEIKVSDATSQYDTTILTEEEKLKLSLGDESYAGITYSSIEARTADGGQTTEIYIKNHDNSYTYDKTITSAADNTDMSDGTSAANRYLSKDTFGVSADNGTDTRVSIQGQVYPGSPNEGLLVISIDDGVYDQNYTNSISLVNNAGDGRISIYQKDETQPYSAKIEMKADTNTVEIKSENGTGTTPATENSSIVLNPDTLVSQSSYTTLIGEIDAVSYTSGVIPSRRNSFDVPIKSTTGGGIDAIFDVEVDGAGVVVTLIVVTAGTGFSVGDEITLSGADLGGVDGTDDMDITVDVIIPQVIVDTISLDPQGLGNGTGIKSEDTTTGDYSILMINPSNPSFDCSDGTDGASIALTKTTLSIGVAGTTTPSFNSILFTQENIEFKTRISKYIDANLIQTTTNAVTTLFTYVPSGSSSSKAIYFKAYVTAVDSTLTNVYGAELFGVFKNNAGTVTQVSTTNKIEKTLFSTATSTIDTDGTNIRVRVTGETSTIIDWEVRVEYND